MRFCREKFGFLKFLVDIATRIRFCYAKSGNKGGILTLGTQTTPTQENRRFSQSVKIIKALEAYHEEKT